MKDKLGLTLPSRGDVGHVGCNKHYDVIPHSADVIKSSNDVIQSSVVIQHANDVIKNSLDVIQNANDVIKNSGVFQRSGDVIKSYDIIKKPVENIDDVIKISAVVIDTNDDVIVRTDDVTAQGGGENYVDAESMDPINESTVNDVIPMQTTWMRNCCVVISALERNLADSYLQVNDDDTTHQQKSSASDWFAITRDLTSPRPLLDYNMLNDSPCVVLTKMDL
uniref:Uncharacterized protein n=1 Tax=Ciona savignyi TaxID=51511 RepID=H2YBB5_CIOSA